MKKNSTIYIFGNALLDFDNLPIKLQPQLEKIFPEIKFVIQDPNENLRPENKELVIIDTVMGIEKVIVIENLEQITSEKKYSLHDLDLGFNLKLLQNLGLLEKITIFGVPPTMNEKIALEQLVKLIKNQDS